MNGNNGVRRYALKGRRDVPVDLGVFFAGEGNGGEPRAPKSDFEASGSWGKLPLRRLDFSFHNEPLRKKEGAKR